VGANSDIGVGTLLVKSVTQASLESRRLTLAKARNLRSRQIRDRETIVLGWLGKIRICVGRDSEVAKTDRGVLVTASICEVMLGPNETAGPKEPIVTGGRNLGPIVKVSAVRVVA
jgi:hypothetical protein